MFIKEPDVLKRAIQVYGGMGQSDIAIEEMAELTKAIIKKRRLFARAPAKALAKCNTKICEEIADVYIMLEQLAVIYDPESERIQDFIDRKVERLSATLREVRGWG